MGRSAGSGTSWAYGDYRVIRVATIIVAAKHGLNVLITEKTQYFGSTTAYTVGGAYIPESQNMPLTE